MTGRARRIGFRLYHGTAALSRAIQVQTWSDINHAGVEFLDDGLVCEALGTGLTLRATTIADAGHSADTVIHAFDFDIPEAPYAKALAFARAHHGDRYDWVSLVAFSGVLRSVFQRTSPLARKSSGIWICSEFFEVIARMVDVAFVRDHRDPATVTPADLWDSLRCDMAHGRRLYALNRWQVLA